MAIGWALAAAVCVAAEEERLRLAEGLARRGMHEQASAEYEAFLKEAPAGDASDDARFALKKMDIDELGLDDTDRGLLRALIEKFGGGPAGLETLAATINEDANTIEDVYEPYLMQLGFIARTPRGRVCLKGAYEHMGMKMSEKQKAQISMFDDE